MSDWWLTADHKFSQDAYSQSQGKSYRHFILMPNRRLTYNSQDQEEDPSKLVAGLIRTWLMTRSPGDPSKGMLYVGSTLIKSKSNRQGGITASTYGVELHVGRTATEEALSVRYLMQSLGIHLDGPTILLGDNESSLISVTNPKSSLSQRQRGISFQLSRESKAASATTRYHVKSEANISDGLTKALESSAFQWMYKSGGPIFV